MNVSAAMAASSVAAGTSIAGPSVASAVATPDTPGRTVRDALWIWGHSAGAHNTEWNLPHSSRMTPVEGAFYLGTPNMIMVRYNGKPAMPFDQEIIACRPLRRVVWSITGAGAATSQEEREHVLDLAARFPNIRGFMMDDFFAQNGTGALTTDQLRGIRERLVIGGTRRDLYVVVYTNQLESPIQSHLDCCDKVTLWTWRSEDLKDLEKNFRRFEEIAPNQGKLLGCYMWDYGVRAPMPLDRMKQQCELALEWLGQKRIEGIIFLASCICDLELDAVEFVRKWIAEVESQSLWNA